jgi:hypothetical protein
MRHVAVRISSIAACRSVYWVKSEVSDSSSSWRLCIPVERALRRSRPWTPKRISAVRGNLSRRFSTRSPTNVARPSVASSAPLASGSWTRRCPAHRLALLLSEPAILLLAENRLDHVIDPFELVARLREGVGGAARCAAKRRASR